MIGILLYIVASVGKITLAPFLYSYGFILAIRRKELGKWHKDMAIAKDQYGNVLGKYYFNNHWIKPGGHKFGNTDETISSSIGKNKLQQTLKGQGLIIDNILNKLDKNHSIDAIEKDE